MLAPLSQACLPVVVVGSAASALLGGVYATGVFIVGRLLDPATGDSALAVAASTLAVAVLFQLLAVVDQTMQPAQASLWLRPASTRAPSVQ